MKTTMNGLVTCALLGALTALLGSADPARAEFADSEVGARGMALGGAFVAVDGDPSSMFWNPAGILSERKLQLSGMRTRLFDGLDGVNEDFVGLTFRLKDGMGAGIGWTRVGLEDVYYEDVINGSFAMEIREDLQVGVSVLFFGADAPGLEALADPSYRGRQWEPSASVGALYRYSENLQFGVSLENLLRPKMSLLGEEENVDPIGGRRRVGAAYLIQGIVRVTGEVRYHDFPDYYNRDITYHAGAESWFNDVLALRVGLDAGDLTAGAGIRVDRIRFDGGLLTNERLGNTFRAAVTVGY